MISALGLDLGASGIRAISSDSNKPIAEVALGPTAASREQDTVMLIGTIAKELGNPKFDSVCLGMSGYASLQVDPKVVAQSLHETLQATKVTVTSDMVTGHYSHFQEQPGVVLVVGTGALAFGVSETSYQRVDGLGLGLGDFGSAAWIGHEAMRLAKRASELEANSKLLTALELELGSSSSWPRLLASQEISIFAIASLAKLVAKLAADGEAISHGIMQEAGSHVAQSAIACANKLGITEVAYGGGVLNNDASIATAACLERLHAAGLTATKMTQEPGLGALALAASAGSERLNFLAGENLATTVKF